MSGTHNNQHQFNACNKKIINNDLDMNIQVMIAHTSKLDNA